MLAGVRFPIGKRRVFDDLAISDFEATLEFDALLRKSGIILEAVTPSAITMRAEMMVFFNGLPSEAG